MYTVQLTKRVHQTLSWIHWIIVTKNKYCVIFVRNWVLLTISPLNEIHRTETNIISTIFHRSLSILLYFYLCYVSAYLVLKYTMLYVYIRIEIFDVHLVLSSFLGFTIGKYQMYTCLLLRCLCFLHWWINRVFYAFNHYK